MNLSEIRRWVVRPVLERAELWSLAAENLILGTGLAESGFEFLDQRDLQGRPGPAFGPWQIEELTYTSLWFQELSQMTRMNCLAAIGFDEPPHVDELHGNLFLGALTCRMKYLTIHERLPDASDASGMAVYWKKYYNTFAGKGNALAVLPYFRTACT